MESSASIASLCSVLVVWRGNVCCSGHKSVKGGGGVDTIRREAGEQMCEPRRGEGLLKDTGEHCASARGSLARSPVLSTFPRSLVCPTQAERNAYHLYEPLGGKKRDGEGERGGIAWASKQTLTPSYDCQTGRIPRS